MRKVFFILISFWVFNFSSAISEENSVFNLTEYREHLADHFISKQFLPFASVYEKGLSCGLVPDIKPPAGEPFGKDQVAESINVLKTAISEISQEMKIRMENLDSALIQYEKCPGDVEFNKAWVSLISKTWGRVYAWENLDREKEGIKPAVLFIDFLLFPPIEPNSHVELMILCLGDADETTMREFRTKKKIILEERRNYLLELSFDSEAGRLKTLNEEIANLEDSDYCEKFDEKKTN